MDSKIKNRLLQNLECLEHLRPLHVEDESPLFASARKILKNKSATLPLELVVEISEYYKIPVDFLLKRDLSQLSRREERELFKGLRKQMVVQEDFDTVTIFFVSKARAGFYISTTDPTGFPELVLPKRLFPGVSTRDYRAFEVEGDSMPPIESGSVIVAELLEGVSEVIDGHRYIIVHRDGIYFKRICRESGFSKTGKLRFISDNEEVQEFTISLEEVKEVWLPKMVMDRFEEVSSY